LVQSQADASRRRGLQPVRPTHAGIPHDRLPEHLSAADHGIPGDDVVPIDGNDKLSGLDYLPAVGHYNVPSDHVDLSAGGHHNVSADSNRVPRRDHVPTNRDHNLPADGEHDVPAIHNDLSPVGVHVSADGDVPAANNHVPNDDGLPVD